MKSHQSPVTNHQSLRLSVVWATKNEAENISRSIKSVKDIADELIIFDEYSEDRTEDIAKRLGARVYKNKHVNNFHETKQLAIDKAKGNWILQLDADEVATPDLAEEIKGLIQLSNEKLLKRVLKYPVQTSIPPVTSHQSPVTKKTLLLFARHQQLIERRDGRIGKPTGKIVAFFIPRVNMFMGKPLIHGGVYPDGVIRLIKRGYARLPAKSVHEQMEIDGEVGWLVNPLEHYDSPTFARYISRNNRYTDLMAKEFKSKFKSKINILDTMNLLTFKPFTEFLNLYFRHKGVLDGYRGFIWSFFSAMRFPISYIKYLNLDKKGI